MNRRLVPDEFSVPAGMETERYRLRMLTVGDVEKDYEAVMSSADHLRGVLDPDSPWPDGLTLEQNLIDLGWHQKEFQRRSSFAYTVMSPEEERCLGCVYIYPSETADADVLIWVRKNEAEPLERELFERVRRWMAEEWPFATVRYPGRSAP